MDTFIPRYRYKFKDELPHGDKRYILTYVKQMISEFMIWEIWKIIHLLFQRYKHYLMALLLVAIS